MLGSDNQQDWFQAMYIPENLPTASKEEGTYFESEAQIPNVVSSCSYLIQIEGSLLFWFQVIFMTQNPMVDRCSMENFFWWIELIWESQMCTGGETVEKDTIKMVLKNS